MQVRSNDPSGSKVDMKLVTGHVKHSYILGLCELINLPVHVRLCSCPLFEMFGILHTFVLVVAVVHSIWESLSHCPEKLISRILHSGLSSV